MDDDGCDFTGVGSVGLAALATAWALLTFSGDSQGFTLWTWVSVGEFQPTMGVVVDRLSLVMMSIITGVGFLIHLFAVWYMVGEAGITRFYAWMNLLGRRWPLQLRPYRLLLSERS